MKINTDGVLLGAIASADSPSKILDIGTGTGVIALMLAQRFGNAAIDAVEVDAVAAETADRNFSTSSFAERLHVYAKSFEKLFADGPELRYDLIVSNPPFYVNSLKSPGMKITLAKHADKDFFEKLIRGTAKHLTEKGLFWMILPVQTAELVKLPAAQNGLHLLKTITVHSFEHSEPHREIVCWGVAGTQAETDKFVIYSAKDLYSDAYKKLLKPYFMAF